jgi:NADPH2:quinone reductase
MCASAGIRTAGTCREANLQYVRDLGADVTIDYRNSDIVKVTRGWCAGGVDIVLDCVSGGSDHTLFDVLRPGGRLVVIATADHDGDVQVLQVEAAKRGTINHFFVLDHSRLVATLDNIRDCIDARSLRMPEVTEYPLAEAARALAAMEGGGIRGKIAIERAQL